MSWGYMILQEKLEEVEVKKVKKVKIHYSLVFVAVDVHLV